MEIIKGTNVVGPITPYSTLDKYPTHYAEYGKGGYRTVNTLADLNSIPADRCEKGMLVYVIAENKAYVCGGLDTENNLNWKESDLWVSPETYNTDKVSLSGEIANNAYGISVLRNSINEVQGRIDEVEAGIESLGVDIGKQLEDQNNAIDKKIEDQIADQEKKLQEGLAGVQDKLGLLQNQVDGEVVAWFLEGTPSLNNQPASDWNTDDIKNQHIGDTYTNIEKYDPTVIDSTAGQSWRWCYCEYTDENGETKTDYHWHKIADSDAIKALQEAGKAQFTADGKSKTFLTKPTNYNIGDLWILQSDKDHLEYKKGEILTASKESDIYVEEHWSKQVKYTDDTLAQAAKDAAEIAQNKAEEAYSDAQQALEDLKDVHADGRVYRSEMKILLNELEDVKQEKTKLKNEADAYDAKTYYNEYESKANNAITALEYYSSPTNLDKITKEVNGVNVSETLDYITIDKEGAPKWKDISLYYAARQQLLYEITAAAKALTDNVNELATTANNAATTANNAATEAKGSADKALGQLGAIATDSVVAAIEFAALETQLEIIEGEYGNILNNAAVYEDVLIDYTRLIENYKTAYSNAVTTLKYYSGNEYDDKGSIAQPDENGSIVILRSSLAQTTNNYDDYDNIEKYYPARQELLDAVARATRTYAESLRFELSEEDINNVLAGIEIGGTNLLKNSKAREFKPWESTNDIKCDINGEFTTITNNVESRQSYCTDIYQLDEDTVKNDIANLDWKGHNISISLEVKSTESQQMRVEIASRTADGVDIWNKQGQYTQLVADKWTKLNLTFKAGYSIAERVEGNTPGVVYLIVNSDDHISPAPSKLDIKNIKIEFGSMSTDWSPAPADVEESINYTNALIGDIQDQVDSVAESYFLEGTPTMSNAPVNSWSDSDYAKHVGDTYTDISEYSVLMPSMWQQGSITQDTDINNCGKDQDSDHYIRTDYIPVDNCYNLTRLSAEYDYVIFYYDAENTCLGVESIGNNVENTDNYNIVKNISDKTVSYIRLRLAYKATDPQEFKPDYVYDIDIKPSINPSAGKSFRFCDCDATNDYHWCVIPSDSEVSKALAAAAQAQDTADGKRRVFTGSTDPIPPYEVGDLWAQGASNGSDLMMCQTSRLRGETGDASDWVSASSALSAANSAFEAASAAVGVAGEAMQNLSDMSNDEKLTPSEKLDVISEWQRIQSEYTTNAENVEDLWEAEGNNPDAWNDYKDAYDDLEKYITDKLELSDKEDETGNIDRNKTTDIDRTEFNNWFNTYYNCNITLQYVIAEQVAALEVKKINFGGANLLLNSKPYDNTNWECSNGNIDFNNYTITCNSDNNNIAIYATQSLDFNLNNDKEYTFSAWIKADSEGKIKFTVKDNSNTNIEFNEVTVGSDWMRYIATTKATNITTSNNTKFWIEYVKSENTDPNNGSTLYLKELKLEKGNVASDWSPASADLIDSIRHAEEYVNAIKDQLQNQIDGVVDSWFIEGEPTLTKKPVTDWKAEAENDTAKLNDIYKRHVGDTYTDISELTLLTSNLWQQGGIAGSTGNFYESETNISTKDFIKNNGGLLYIPSGYQFGILYFDNSKTWKKVEWKTTNYTLDVQYPYFKLNVSASTNTSTTPIAPDVADTLRFSINPTAGQSWRWCPGNGEGDTTNTGYHWHKIADSDAVKALVAAAQAQDTADGKRRVFTGSVKPVPPYDEGDLWAQGAGEDGDIFMCTEGRQTGEFNTSDWVPASGAMTILNNIASDGVITKIEKIQLRKEVEIIQHETSWRYSKAMDIWGMRYDENGGLYIADYPQAGQDYYNAVIRLENYIDKIKIDEDEDTKLSDVGSSWEEYQEIFDKYYLYREQFDLVLDDDSINYKTGNSNNLLRHTYQKKYFDKFKGHGCEVSLNDDWILVAPDQGAESTGCALVTDVINNKDLLISGARYTLSFDLLTDSDNDVEDLIIGLLFYTEKSSRLEDWCGEYLIYPIENTSQNFADYGNNRYSISFTYKQEESHLGYFGIAFASFKDTYDYFLIKNIKLERGDKATAWTPAPEDMEAEIAEVKEAQSNFEKSLSQINNDGYFSITEKKIIRSDWEAISGQYGVDDLLYPEEWEESIGAKFNTWEELAEAIYGEDENMVTYAVLLLLYNAYMTRTGDYGEILGMVEQALGIPLNLSEPNNVFQEYFPSLNTFMTAYLELMALVIVSKLYIPENTPWELLEGADMSDTVFEGLTGREILSKCFEEYYKAETLCLNEINEYYTNNAVNNIKIDHTNLLRNTNQVTYFDKDKFAFTNCEGELTEDGWIKITPNTVGNIYLTTDKISKNVFELNQEYILSFDAYAGEELDLNYIGFCLPDKISGDYYYIPETPAIKINQFEKRYNIKFVCDRNISGNTFGAVIGFYLGSAGNDPLLYIKNIKLQKGIIATDWSPAPEDMDDEIAEVRGLQESFSNSLSQIDDDKYFSVAEKKIIRSDWEAISGYNSTEKIDDYKDISGSFIEAVKMADGKVDYSALAEAFDNLREFLDKYNLYTSENTSWGTEDSPNDSRETLANKFTAYYNAEIEYLNRVNKHYTDSQIPDVSGIQKQIDDVKGLQESFNTSLSNINSDKYFSTVEKKIIRSDWEAVESSYIEVSKLTGDNDIKKSLDTIYGNLSYVITRCKLYENEDTLWSEIFSETTDAEKSRKILSDAFNSYYNKEIEFLNSVNQKYTDSQIPDVDYLTEMWEKGTTEIGGGIVMTNILQMKDADGVTVTAGLSGVNADNILLWGGATYNEAKEAADNNYVKNSGGDLITSLLKKDGTGKLGVLKIGADDVTIDGTNYDIKLDASGLGFFDNENNPVVKLSTEPLESEYSLLNQGTRTDEYIPSYSSGEIGLEFKDYSASGEYTTREIVQELNSYKFKCTGFNTKIKCESGYNSINWKLMQEKDDGSYEDLSTPSSAVQILKNPDLQYTILHHKPLALNPVTVKRWTSLKNNASLSDPFIVPSPGEYEVKIRIYAKFNLRFNGKFETTNIKDIVGEVRRIIKFTVTSTNIENITKLADGGLYSYGGGNNYLYFNNVHGLTVRSGSLLLQLQSEQAGVSGYPGSVRPNNISISYDDGKDVKKLLSVTKDGIMLPNLPESSSAAVGVLCVDSYGCLLIKQKE